MIRSDVGVTLPVFVLARTVCVRAPEALRPVLTTCFEPLLAEPDVFCFLVIG